MIKGTGRLDPRRLLEAGGPWLGAEGLGPGLQGLGAGASRLGPGFCRVLGLSLGPSGAWGGAGASRPPGKRARDTAPTPPVFLGCKGEKKRVFTLSVTETIQHAPQGRRITH